MLDLIKKIAGILDKLKIDYCITGGFAVSVWGRLRSTFDIDIVVKLKQEKIKLIVKQLRLLSKAGYIDELAAVEAVNKGGEFNYIHSDSGIKIDFWVIKKDDNIGISELKRRIGKNIGKQKIYFISPEDLILSKIRWFKESGSDRHLDDIKSVIKFSKADFKYLKQQASKQGTLDILSKLLIF